ncbi:RNA polymerase sigma-70 factor [Pedobacter sp. PAMC26386]|nr:RNA polymerase sigma-70 factor [Pedobacter sp. PAMC26386]
MKDYSRINDNDILLSFLAGDKGAYEVIYDRFWPILYRHARKMLQNEEDAKDVVQEVFTMLWTRVNESTIKPPLAAFLYACTRNKILDLIKHAKVKAKYTSSLMDAMDNRPQLPDALFIERELAGQIEDEVQRLPAKMRLVFELSRKEYKTHKEISLQLNISDQTVKKQVSNALHILKTKLGTFLTFF